VRIFLQIRRHRFRCRCDEYLKQGNKNVGCRDAQKACELGDCDLLEYAKIKVSAVDLLE
jgi:hypothetical protein